MAYRDKPELYSSQPTRDDQRQRRYVFWLIPLFIAPGLIRIAKSFGLKPSPDILLVGTILMGIVCVVGAIISYRVAREQVERDLAEPDRPQR